MTKSQRTRIKMRPSIGTPDVRPIARLIVRSIDPDPPQAAQPATGKPERR